MAETRWHFHEQLAELESIILRMGLAAHDLFRRALDVVVSGNEAEADLSAGLFRNYKMKISTWQQQGRRPS